MNAIKWDNQDADPMHDWRGTLGDVDVDLVLLHAFGMWSFFVDDHLVESGIETRELAQEKLEKHLGIFMPVDAASIEVAFRAELSALLVKYGAEIETSDHYPGYAECGEDIRMIVSVDSIYDASAGDVLREHCEIDLGRCFDGKD